VNWFEWYKKALAYSLATLPLAGVACALLYVINHALTVGVGVDDLDMVALLVLGSVVGLMFYGLPVAALFFAPGYAALRRLGWANWASSLALGIVPGLAALNWERELAWFAIAAGPIVALLTHLLISRATPRPEQDAVA